MKSILDQRQKLLKKRYKALRFGDFDELFETMEDIMEFNRNHPANRIDAKAIKSSHKSHMKSTQEMHHGVLYNPKVRKEVYPLMDDWDF